jgi:hypothetical protein
MPLPDGFNSWEHFQDVVKKVHNKIVREEFADAGEDDNISTPRSSLRQACLIDDNDTADMVIARLLFYYFDLRKARDLQSPIYGVPEESSQVRVAHVPRVFLFFQEDFQDVELGYRPITGEIGVRLIGETPQSLSESKLNSLASRIKNEFANGSGYVWRKGKELYSYVDKNKGYQFKILSRSESEAKELIGKALDINTDSPNWDFLSTSQAINPASKFPTNPGSQTILGKSRKKKRIRPIADVRFQYATLNLQGVSNPIPLVDRSGIFRNALETVY